MANIVNEKVSKRVYTLQTIEYSGSIEDENFLTNEKMISDGPTADSLHLLLVSYSDNLLLLLVILPLILSSLLVDLTLADS